MFRLRRKSLLQEADEIVYGERNSNYGHPIVNHNRTADAWTWWLTWKYADKEFNGFTPEDVCVMMILTKLSRMMNGAENEDDLRDIQGYAENIDIVREVQNYLDTSNPETVTEFEELRKVLNYVLS